MIDMPTYTAGMGRSLDRKAEAPIKRARLTAIISCVNEKWAPTAPILLCSELFACLIVRLVKHVVCQLGYRACDMKSERDASPRLPAEADEILAYRTAFDHWCDPDTRREKKPRQKGKRRARW